MSNTEFKLPQSSFPELKKLLKAYAKSKSPSTLNDLNTLTGMSRTSISTNNGFLESIGVISGGKKKEATGPGRNLGIAIANDMEEEASKILHQLLAQNEFIESMVTALSIKPRSPDDFQSHIAYALGKELKGHAKTATGSVIDMMLFSKLIEEEEGLLSPIEPEKTTNSVEVDTNPTPTPNPSGTTNPQTPNLLTQNFTNELGQNVTLNINVQLTIPDTEDEKVYENFFKAMKKHLLSS